MCEPRALWPQLPCVCVGPANNPEKTRLPLEICEIAPCQPVGGNDKEVCHAPPPPHEPWARRRASP